MNIYINLLLMQVVFLTSMSGFAQVQIVDSIAVSIFDRTLSAHSTLSSYQSVNLGLDHRKAWPIVKELLAIKYGASTMKKNKYYYYYDNDELILFLISSYKFNKYLTSNGGFIVILDKSTMEVKKIHTGK